MKLFTLTLLLCVALAIAVADVPSTKSLTKRALQEDDEWVYGTEVMKEFDDEWYEGLITGYDNGVYTVTWEDDTSDTYGNDEIDQLVADAVTWDIGTIVYKQFEDGDWYQGSITGYDSGVYTVTWSDDDEEAYDNDEIDQLVADAANIPDDADSGAQVDDTFYPVGTIVYKEFDDDWYKGLITGYDDGVYTVTWTDGDEEDYDDLDEVDQMVDDAADIQDDNDVDTSSGATIEVKFYPVGTDVYKEFDDGWYQGSITEYDNGLYTVTWSDGDEEPYDDLDEVDQMVADAKALSAVNQDAGSQSRSDGTVAFIVIGVLGVVGVALFYDSRRRIKTTKEVFEVAEDVGFSDFEVDPPPQII